MKYILAMDYSYEDFDPDGIGEIFRHDTSYITKDSEERILAYLKKNIYEDDGVTKPDLDSVHEYCKRFGFRLYERKH
jgi:hypothetical protein